MHQCLRMSWDCKGWYADPCFALPFRNRTELNLLTHIWNRKKGYGCDRIMHTLLHYAVCKLLRDYKTWVTRKLSKVPNCSFYTTLFDSCFLWWLTVKLLLRSWSCSPFIYCTYVTRGLFKGSSITLNWTFTFQFKTHNTLPKEVHHCKLSIIFFSEKNTI